MDPRDTSQDDTTHDSNRLKVRDEQHSTFVILFNPDLFFQLSLARIISMFVCTCNFLLASTPNPPTCVGGFWPAGLGLSVFLADAGGLGSKDRTKVSVWKRENVAKGIRVSGIGFCIT